MFLTWEWLRPWWRHFRGEGDALYVLAAREGGTLVGLAPLYRGTVSAHGLGSLSRLGFIGDCSGDSEYLGVIAEPGREAAVLAGVFDRIEADGWDVAELRLMPTGSPTCQGVQQLAAGRGWLLETEDVPCSSVALPDDWDSYLKTLQSRVLSVPRDLRVKLPNGSWDKLAHSYVYGRQRENDGVEWVRESVHGLLGINPTYYFVQPVSYLEIVEVFYGPRVMGLLLTRDTISAGEEKRFGGGILIRDTDPTGKYDVEVYAWNGFPSEMGAAWKPLAEPGYASFRVVP